MKKRFITFCLVLWWSVVTIGAAGTVFHLVCDLSAPLYTIELKEKYGLTRMIDSVNIVSECNGSFIVTRAGNLYGIFPRENYSFMIRGR